MDPEYISRLHLEVRFCTIFLQDTSEALKSFSYHIYLFTDALTHSLINQSINRSINRPINQSILYVYIVIVYAGHKEEW